MDNNVLLLIDGMTNIQSEQTPAWNPDIGLRQVIRADNGELVTGPRAAKVGRTVDGSPTEIAGTVMVGGMQHGVTKGVNGSESGAFPSGDSMAGCCFGALLCW